MNTNHQRAGTRRVTFVLAYFAVAVCGQEDSANRVLDLAPAEQVAFVRLALENEFPNEAADKLTMLIINRSDTVLPLIAERIHALLKTPGSSARTVDTGITMIAYAGDEAALKAIAMLTELNDERFGKLVSRTLVNAMNWRNPFAVAYQGLDIGHDRLTAHLVSWAKSSLDSVRMQRLWADFLVGRNGGPLTDEQWDLDPLVVRLAPNPLLRIEMLRATKDAAERRQRR